MTLIAVLHFSAHNGIEYDDLLFTALKGVDGPHLYFLKTLPVELLSNIVHRTSKRYYNAYFINGDVIFQYQLLDDFNQQKQMNLINRTKSPALVFLRQYGTIPLCVNNIDRWIRPVALRLRKIALPGFKVNGIQTIFIKYRA